LLPATQVPPDKQGFVLHGFGLVVVVEVVVVVVVVVVVINRSHINPS